MPDDDANLGQAFAGLERLVRETRHGTLRLLYVEFTPNGSPPASRGDDAQLEAMGATPFELQFNIRTHAIIAYMAEEILNREDVGAFQRLQMLSASDPKARGDVGSLAQWPDIIKHPPPGAVLSDEDKALAATSRPWHYVDVPYNPQQPGGPEIPAGETILSALPEQLKALRSSDPTTAANALAFVLHLVGDIHQPLHCATLADPRFFEPPEWDKGGNGVAWGQGANLHKLWDDSVASRPTEVLALVQELLEQFPRETFEHDNSEDIKEWALGSHSIARTAYDRFLAATEYDEETERFSSPPRTYRRWVKETGRERAARAAYRLADLLKQFLP